MHYICAAVNLLWKLTTARFRPRKPRSFVTPPYTPAHFISHFRSVFEAVGAWRFSFVSSTSKRTGTVLEPLLEPATAAALSLSILIRVSLYFYRLYSCGTLMMEMLSREYILQRYGTGRSPSQLYSGIALGSRFPY